MTGQYQAAVARLSTEIRKRPLEAELHRLLACAYIALGERDRALLAAEDASSLALDPVAWWERVIAGAPDSRPALLGTLEVARLRPTDCAALLRAAETEKRLGSTVEAGTLAERAAKTCPDDPGVALFLAREALSGGCPGSAATRTERLLGARRGDPAIGALRDRARSTIRERFARVDRQVGLLESAVANELGVRSRTRAEELLAHWREAHSLLERIERDREPVDPDLDLRRAALYRVGGEIGVDDAVRKAIEHARRAVAARPTSVEAWVLLGSLALADDPPQVVQATDAFLAAIDLAAPEPLAPGWSGLALAYLASGRERSAIDAADRYLALNPGDSEMRALIDQALADRRR